MEPTEPLKRTQNGHPSKAKDSPKSELGAVATRLQTLVRPEAVQELRKQIDLPRRMKTNPYATLAIAVGAGYVLGGGLFSSLTRRVFGVGLKLGLRLGALALVKQQVGLLAGDVLNPNPKDGVEQ